MQYQSTASRLRHEFSAVVRDLCDLIKSIPTVRRFDDPGSFVRVIAPEFYLSDRLPEQQAKQLALKRRYDVLSEILHTILGDATDNLANRLSEADEQFRAWLELNPSWSVTGNEFENAGKAKEAASGIDEIIDILDVACGTELIVVPDTNSLLQSADPTEYRAVAQKESFVFMLLPTVLGELDKLKIEHRNEIVRDKAKKVISRIKGWRIQGSLSSGVIVDKSITVKAGHKEPNMKKTLSWLDAFNDDDRIIASILALEGEYPADHVLLISSDINLLNKADAALIHAAELT